LHTQEPSFVKVFFRLFFLLLVAANALGQNNEIYVVDIGPNRGPPYQILKYDENGKNPQVFITSELDKPQDIVFLEQSNTAIVSNLQSDRITKHDATTGNYIGDFAVVKPDGPTRMKIGSDNLLYVLQWFGNGKVMRYQLDGTFVDEFTNIGVSQSIGLDWDSQGNLYVASFNQRRVRKFDIDGKHLGGFINADLLGPTNIWFDANGDLLVLDWSGTTVKRFDSNGNFVEVFMSRLSQAEGIEILANGHFLIGNGGTSAVKQFDENGVFVKDFISSGSGGLATPVAVVRRQPPGFEINAGLKGAWYNSETAGQGQLIDIEPEGQFMFLSWFAFTDMASENPNEQHWFTAQGNYSGNSAELVLYETLGGQFNSPQEVSTNPVGSFSVSFVDCGNAEANYTIDTWDLEGSFPLSRAIPGTENVCQDLSKIAAESLEMNDSWDGAWFDNNAPGQGFLMDAQTKPEGDDFIFVSWFTYGEDSASGQRWLTAQGSLKGTTADLVVYETTGGSFDQPDFDETKSVGSMTINFVDCSNAMLTFSLPGESLEGDIQISRAILGTEKLCQEFDGQND
jgi:hypothetical protein